jgi:hypothetical protein
MTYVTWATARRSRGTLRPPTELPAQEAVFFDQVVCSAAEPLVDGDHANHPLAPVEVIA